MGTVDRSSWQRHLRARRNPLPVGLESHADPVVVDPQVSVPATHNGLRRDFLHFLRQYADIDLVRAIVGKPIKPDAVAQIGKTNNVVLERNIGPPSAAPASPSASRGHRSPVLRSGGRGQQRTLDWDHEPCATARDGTSCKPSCGRSQTGRYVDETDGSPGSVASLGWPACPGPDRRLFDDWPVGARRACCDPRA